MRSDVVIRPTFLSTFSLLYVNLFDISSFFGQLLKRESDGGWIREFFAEARQLPVVPEAQPVFQIQSSFQYRQVRHCAEMRFSCIFTEALHNALDRGSMDEGKAQESASTHVS